MREHRCESEWILSLYQGSVLSPFLLAVAAVVVTELARGVCCGSGCMQMIYFW